MGDEAQIRDELLARIRARRERLNAYIRDVGPRGTRLNNISIVTSAVTSVLVAGPALGGKPFTVVAQQTLSLPNDQIVWQVLCLLAMLCSLTATITANMYKSYSSTDQLGKAEAGTAKLEGLETMILLGQLSTAEAARQYQQSLTETPFVHDL